jgi:hypothetical protein
MLIAAGELGYRNVTVAHVVARLEPGVDADFDRHFVSITDCFNAAYEVGCEYVCATLLSACAAENDWIRGLRGALVRLFELVEREPAITRALLVEGQAADRQTLSKHQEVIERLSHAIDGARRETVSRHSSSPLTGTFIIGAIEFAVCSSLLDREASPDKLWQELPGLMHFAVLPFQGEEAAWAVYDETKAMVEARS